MRYAMSNAYGLSSLQERSAQLGMGTISAELAHRRLGHCGSYAGRINKDQLGMETMNQKFDCEACGLSKSQRIVSRENQTRATRPGQLVHVDLHPIKPKGYNTLNGKCEMEHNMVITDDFSRMRFSIKATLSSF